MQKLFLKYCHICEYCKATLTVYKNNKHENILRLLFKISTFLKFDCFISSLSNQMLKFLYIFFSSKITGKDVLKSNFRHFLKIKISSTDTYQKITLSYLVFELSDCNTKNMLYNVFTSSQEIFIFHFKT